MWQEKDNQLYREFNFKDFKQAFEFIKNVARVSEEQNHHPRWQNEWNNVKIWLTTHEAGDKITDKDKSLAKLIDQVFISDDMTKTDDKNTAKNKQIKLYTDGGSRGNPGPSASGYVLLDMNDNVLIEHGIYLGVTTNNQAEYQALKLGLEEALRLKAQEVSVYMDSLLVVNQITGEFKIRNRDLWPIHDAIQDLVKYFKQVTFTHIPRELNKLADAMVNQALDEHLDTSS